MPRDDLVEVLTAWRYEPRMETNGFDDLIFSVPGSFDDIGRALDEGILDAATYDLILDVSPERIDQARLNVREIVERHPSLSGWIETNRADFAGALTRPGYLRHHDFCPALRSGDRRSACTCWKSIVWQVTTRSSSSGADGPG